MKGTVRFTDLMICYFFAFLLYLNRKVDKVMRLFFIRNGSEMYRFDINSSLSN